MQHKQRRGKPKNYLLMLTVLAGAAAVVLMMVPVPPPQNSINKPLDAKVFLESKQQ